MSLLPSAGTALHVRGSRTEAVCSEPFIIQEAHMYHSNNLDNQKTDIYSREREQVSKCYWHTLVVVRQQNNNKINVHIM